MNSDLLTQYSARRKQYLEPAAEKIRKLLVDYLEGEPRIDRIAARAKAVDSFLEKAEKNVDGNAVYNDPLNQIQDQIGARIITFYLSDVERIAGIVKSYFRLIEEQLIIPEKDSEFGYFGRHFVLLCPSDIFDNDTEKENCPNFFELQIKTLYQHAWSEAEHDLGYKGHTALSTDERRKVALTAAQSWGSDMMFEELFSSKKS